MSRVAKQPIVVPAGVTLKIEGQRVKVVGPRGELQQEFHSAVNFLQEGNTLLCQSRGDDNSKDSAQSGTARAIIQNMVLGVTQLFEKRLQLVGVGYKAQVQGSKVTLNLGLSHPVFYDVEPGVSVTCPSALEIVIQGADKQRVGQIAADLRAFRPPEPYKGKGIRYFGEIIQMKEAKKK